MFLSEDGFCDLQMVLPDSFDEDNIEEFYNNHLKVDDAIL